MINNSFGLNFKQDHELRFSFAENLKALRLSDSNKFWALDDDDYSAMPHQSLDFIIYI